MSEMQEYIGEDEDALRDIGNLADVNVPRAMINVEKPKREVLECTALELTNEPRDANGNSEAKGVFVEAAFHVLTGPNQGYEWKERWYGDTRIKAGKTKSAFRSVLYPKLVGLAMAVKGKQHEQTFYVGAFQSMDTALNDITMRAQGLCGQRFQAEVGLEYGSELPNQDNIPKAQRKHYQDKQVIKGFVPAQN